MSVILLWVIWVICGILGALIHLYENYKISNYISIGDLILAILFSLFGVATFIASIIQVLVYSLEFGYDKRVNWLTNLFDTITKKND